ncbi:MAG: hypothetical protein WC325_11520 [Candidatus Bathyarchaeia archaeon]
MAKEVCSPNLEAGLIVSIYEDPVTEKKLEGKAKLVRKTSVADSDLGSPVGIYSEPKLGRLETWIVSFGGFEDHEEVTRAIRVHVNHETMNHEQKQEYYTELYFATHSSGALSTAEVQSWKEPQLDEKIQVLLKLTG